MIGGTTLSRELENDNKGSVTTKIMKYQSRANTLSNSMDGLTKLPAMSIQFATCWKRDYLSLDKHVIFFFPLTNLQVQVDYGENKSIQSVKPLIRATQNLWKDHHNCWVVARYLPHVSVSTWMLSMMLTYDFRHSSLSFLHYYYYFWKWWVIMTPLFLQGYEFFIWFM